MACNTNKELFANQVCMLMPEVVKYERTVLVIHLTTWHFEVNLQHTGVMQSSDSKIRMLAVNISLNFTKSCVVDIII